jgi:hypothetical protein
MFLTPSPRGEGRGEAFSLFISFTAFLKHIRILLPLREERVVVRRFRFLSPLPLYLKHTRILLPLRDERFGVRRFRFSSPLPLF